MSRGALVDGIEDVASTKGGLFVEATGTGSRQRAMSLLVVMRAWSRRNFHGFEHSNCISDGCAPVRSLQLHIGEAGLVRSWRRRCCHVQLGLHSHIRAANGPSSRAELCTVEGLVSVVLADAWVLIALIDAAWGISNRGPRTENESSAPEFIRRVAGWAWTGRSLFSCEILRIFLCKRCCVHSSFIAYKSRLILLV